MLKQRVRLCAVAWNVLRDRQQAEDLFQETVLKAIRRLDSFENRDHLVSWSVVAIRNAAIDAMRQRQTRSAILSELALEKLDQHRAAQSQSGADTDRLDALTLCLKKLPENLRDLVRQRYIHGKSGAELAVEQKLSLDAIYKRLSRVHRQLRECVIRKLQHLRPDRSGTSAS